MNVLEHLEALAQFAHERFGEEMAEARKQYFLSLGIMHESDELYEEAMKAHLDYFLFERALPGTDKTPLDVFLENATNSLASAETDVYAGFKASRRSLFDIRKVGIDFVECRDVFRREKTLVREDNTAGFFRNDLFEARVLPFQGEWRFGDMMRFHPTRAARAIHKAAKRIGRDDPQGAKDLMMQLAACKAKHVRLPRIDLLQFYGPILKQPRS